MVNVSGRKLVKCPGLAEGAGCKCKWIAKANGLRKQMVCESKCMKRQGLAKANGFTIVNVYYRKAICFCYFFLSFGFAIAN